MSEYFRRLVKRDPPPAALIRFRCAKLHRASAPGSDSSSSEYNTIYDVLRARGWKETDVETEWHIFWSDKDWIHGIFDKIHLDPHQHVNHFLNHYELTRKDLLVKNMKRMRRQLEKEGRPEEANKYNVYPITFVVPQEYNMFVEEFKKHAGATWIMKPVGRSQGAGIFLVNKLTQLQQWRPSNNWKPPKDSSKDPDDEDGAKEGPELYVVQKYLDDPLLVGGKKFDIRLYVLVTSYQPLTVYMHRAGFCRFSMSRYSNDMSDMKNLGQHLTNVAVQKHSGKAAYKRTGAKWEMHRFKSYVVNVAGLDTANRMLSDIESIIIHSLLSVQKVMINDKHCFELYGYDILIDAKFRPWLLEVNASPSLTANTCADYDMKFGLLDDVMSLLDFEKYLTGQELQIGGFDLLYRDGLRFGPPEGSLNRSYLGSANNRGAQLERLAKARAIDFANGTATGLAPPTAPGPSSGPSGRGADKSGDKSGGGQGNSNSAPPTLWETSRLERRPRSMRPYPTPA
eukprot:CAMPEP_0206423768 /NCGR_PEP_ID=MMETSP0324_2-20121206/2853_1 /ASSEMBLY_ACC=CAM_ASM_000836 /TAXON_ID=2866 /ORGANISM="Crypthecodinium cohnii, Strain Seligo" /LENGTH=510 /DNA_ID=CAMNT_0053888343 /DNA_START=230 /DNA_END=1758 /DNA_ORIENTATION=-